MGLFGILVSGCLPVTQFETVSDFMCSLNVGVPPEEFMVFLTGEEPLPPDVGMAVYITNGDPFSQESSMYLGCITNEVPSRMMRLPLGTFMGSNSARLFFCIELLREIKNRDDASTHALISYQNTSVQRVARRIAKDLFNYLISYAKVRSANSEDPQAEDNIYLPSSWAKNWLERVNAKIMKDNHFFAEDP